MTKLTEFTIDTFVLSPLQMHTQKDDDYGTFSGAQILDSFRKKGEKSRATWNMRVQKKSPDVE